MKQVIAQIQVFDENAEILYCKDFLTPADVNAACQLFARDGYEISITFLDSEKYQKDNKTQEEDEK